jgi:hypothetical protein
VNRDRRARLDTIRAMVEEIKTNFEQIVQDLTDIGAEEQEAFDNMSEGLQASENGQRIEAATDAIGEAVGSLEDADLQSVLDSIDDAVSG